MARYGDTLRKIQAFGNDAALLANVIINWHSNPTPKLKGVLWLLEHKHEVRIASYSIDTAIVDGRKVRWQEFENPHWLLHESA